MVFSVTTVDLSEILGNANKLTADDKSVKEKLEKIHAYTNTGLTPPDKLVQIAKLDVVLADFMDRELFRCICYSVLDILAKKLWL
jgi:L-fucose isomerase-like protein